MPSKLTPVLARCLITGSLLSSCLTAYHQQAYYTSPFNGSSERYHTLPLHTDSVRTAFFAQGSLFTGAANDFSTDDLSGGTLSAYVAQHQGIWQWWAGLDLTAGSYSLGNWHSRYTTNYFFVNYDRQFLAPVTADQLNALSGSRFFGGAGFSGGVNAVQSRETSDFVLVTGGCWVALTILPICLTACPNRTFTSIIPV